MKELYVVLIMVLIPGMALGTGMSADKPAEDSNPAVVTLDGGSSYPVNLKQEQEKSHQKKEKEHPQEAEHPAEVKPQEHPEEGEHPAEAEHPEGGAEHPVSERPTPTIETVAVYLEGYVAKKASQEGGWMKIRDERANTTLKLKLDKIHRERLARTDKGTFFVCADFKTPEGKVYDLDFWVKDTQEGLTVTETTIHKEEGKPRYMWVEEDGIWSQKPLKGN